MPHSAGSLCCAVVLKSGIGSGNYQLCNLLCFIFFLSEEVMGGKK